MGPEQKMRLQRLSCKGDYDKKTYQLRFGLNVGIAAGQYILP